MAMREYSLNKRILKFLRKIRIGLETGCWIWIGKRNSQSYRLSWHLFRGNLLTGHDIHHKCFNNRCVNPNHLEMLTEEEHAKRHGTKPREIKIYQQPDNFGLNVLMNLEDQ